MTAKVMKGTGGASVMAVIEPQPSETCQCMACVLRRCIERQAKEIKRLRARVRELEPKEKR